MYKQVVEVKMKKDIFYENYANKLTGEYHDIYQQISIYIAASLSPGDDGEEVMNEIIDLLLSAQEDMRPIDSVIGKDIQYFCDQMIASHKRSLSEKLIRFLNFYRILALIGFILEGFALLFDIVDGLPSPWNTNVQMGFFFVTLVFSLFLSFVFKFFAKKAVFKFSWYTHHLDSALTTILIVIFFISIFIIPEEVDALVPIPRWLFLPVMLMIYIVLTIRKKQDIKKQKAEGNYFSFFDEVSKESRNETILMFRKKYRKYIQKCERKKQTPMDVREWYEMKFHKDKRGDLYGSIFFILLLSVVIIGTFLTNEWIDSIIFTIILLMIEIPIYRFLYKGKLMRLEIHHMIHELDTDIFDDRLIHQEESVLFQAQ